MEQAPMDSPMTDFSLTNKQKEAIKLLGSNARHIMLFGGS